MTTVASRTLRSSPHRDAHQTWMAIVDLLVQGKTDGARAELIAVAGVAASIIADQVPREAPIIVTCDGPRTRIYCLYGDDALDNSDANEGALGFPPLKGDWRVSLPCLAEDLDWVRKALATHGARITAREPGDAVEPSSPGGGQGAASLQIDPKGFLGT